MTVPPSEVVNGVGAPTHPSADGRRQRGERNREAVIDAILDLITEGNERPTTTEIAERSGVSVRSVFRHFDDVESLYAAAVDRHIERMLPLWHLDMAPGSLDVRLGRLVDHRATLYEAMGTVRRVAERLRRTSPTIDRRLRYGHRVLVEQLETLFAPELAALTSDDRRTLLDALDIGTSWYAWVTLREVDGHSSSQASAVLGRIASALLGSVGTHP
jgi:AcrR family transcriptional regulator